MSLIIPSWNGRDHLPVCLSSVARLTVRPAETVLVDNGSDDGSPEMVAEQFPWVRVLKLDSNHGFAAAVNAGIRASSGVFVALLNNDTELDSRWLENLLHGLGSHPGAGSAASLMLDFAERDRVDSAGDMLSRSGVPLARGAGRTLEPQHRDRALVFSACAGAALYRRALFETVGLFDEAFVSYLEDADLGFRAQMAGYPCVFVPDAVCYHKRGATAGRISRFAVRMLERNLVLLYAKNLPPGALVRLLPVIAGAQARHLIRSVKAGTGLAVLRGLAQGLVTIPRVLPGRKTSRRLRKVSVAGLLQMLGRETL